MNQDTNNKSHITYENIDKEALLAFFEKRLEEFKCPSKQTHTYKVLYIGACFQSSLLYPFLCCLVKKISPGQKIQVITAISSSSFGVASTEPNHPGLFRDMTFLDRDEFESLANTKNDILQFYPDLTAQKKVTIDTKKSIKIDFSQQQIEETVKDNAVKTLLEEKEFDFVFCLFESHFEVNWRVGLLNLLPYLKDGGDYIFADVSGSFEKFDGNFKNQLDQLGNQIKDEDKLRSKSHYWKPEISVTNYKELRGQIGRVFDKVIDSGEIPDGKTSINGFFRKADTIVLSKQRVIDVIQFGLLNYFQLGILGASDYKQKLTTKIRELEKESFELESDLQIYWAQKFNKNWLNGLKSREWNFSALLKDLQQINDNTLPSLGRKALDVLASHDMILPHHTNYLALIEWTDPKSSEWAYPIHFLINDRVYLERGLKDAKEKNQKKSTEDEQKKPALKDQLAANVKAWFQQEKDIGISLAQAIFQKTKRKNIFRFICFKEDKFNTLRKSQGYLSMKVQSELLFKFLSNTKKESCKIRYYISRDRKGNIKELDIYVSPNWSNKPADLPVEESQKIKTQEIITNVLSRYQIQEPLDLNVKNTRESKKYETKKKKKKKHVELFKAFGITQQKELEDIVSLVLLTHFNKETRANHELTFFPSAIIEKRDQSTSVEIEGLGGIILYEECIDSTDTALKTLYTARNKALIDATNLIFYKASIVSHVDQDFKRHARKAAIAAINARNSSHVIGSHVLPDIINDVDRRFEKEDHQFFFRYLMRRGEYIAQLTSEFPTWSVPTWFGKELMAELYNQYCLLDSIASAEGIRCYNCSMLGEKIQQKPNYNSLVLNLRKRCWHKVVNNTEYENQGKPVSQHLSVPGLINLADGIPRVGKKNESSKKYYGIIVKNQENNEYGFLYFMENYKTKNNYNKINSNFVLNLNFSPPLSPKLHEELTSGRRAIVKAKLSLDGKTLENATILEISGVQILVDSCSKKWERNQLLHSDVQVSIPGGITGYHAFYIIIENIIRNAAKHDWYHLPEYERRGKKLILNIELDEKKVKNNNFYICKIWADCTKTRVYPSQEIYLMGKESPTSLRTIINQFLEEDIILMNGAPVKDHLGISEIKLNATFLHNKSLDNDENIGGKKIILNDKDFESEGHIKASEIWELDSAKDQLVSHLGYRFKLLKPKEVLVISDQKNSLFEEYQEDILSQHNIEILSHKEAFNKENRYARLSDESYNVGTVTSGLDYEFCVIVADENLKEVEESEVKSLSLFGLLYRFIAGSLKKENPKENLTEDQIIRPKVIFDILCDVIEAYPYRLFLFFNTCPLLYDVFFTLKNPPESLLPEFRNEFVFIRSRFFLLDEGPKVNISTESLEKFKNDLYIKWLHIYQISIDENQKVKYKLLIKNKSGQTIQTKGYYPKTLPYQYRSLFFSDKVDVINETREKNTSKSHENYQDEKEYCITYERHFDYKDISKDNLPYYADNITGKSNVFFRVSSLFELRVDDYLWKKSINFFFENAFSIVMIIDERLLEFIKRHQGSKDVNTIFLLKNIIIPFKICKNQDIIYSRSYSFHEEIGNMKKIEVQNQEGESISIEFIQPPLSQKSVSRNIPDDYLINTLIIHQSFLEKISSKNILEKKFNENVLIKKLKVDCKIPSIIISTGRGRTSYQNYRYAKYVPFSIIESSLINKNPDKLSLMDLLFKTLN